MMPNKTQPNDTKEKNENKSVKEHIKDIKEKIKSKYEDWQSPESYMRSQLGDNRTLLQKGGSIVKDAVLGSLLGPLSGLTKKSTGDKDVDAAMEKVRNKAKEQGLGEGDFYSKWFKAITRIKAMRDELKEEIKRIADERKNDKNDKNDENLNQNMLVGVEYDRKPNPNQNKGTLDQKLKELDRLTDQLTDLSEIIMEREDPEKAWEEYKKSNNIPVNTSFSDQIIGICDKNDDLRRNSGKDVKNDMDVAKTPVNALREYAEVIRNDDKYLSVISKNEGQKKNANDILGKASNQVEDQKSQLHNSVK